MTKNNGGLYQCTGSFEVWYVEAESSRKNSWQPDKAKQFAPHLEDLCYLYGTALTVLSGMQKLKLRIHGT